MRRTLLHTLFPVVRAEILRLLFTNRGQELYVRQLARLSFLTLHTVQQELGNLRAAGLVISRSNGYHRFNRANTDHALYSALRRVVMNASERPMPIRATRGRRIKRRAEKKRSGPVRVSRFMAPGRYKFSR